MQERSKDAAETGKSNELGDCADRRDLGEKMGGAYVFGGRSLWRGEVTDPNRDENQNGELCWWLQLCIPWNSPLFLVQVCFILSLFHFFFPLAALCLTQLCLLEPWFRWYKPPSSILFFPPFIFCFLDHNIHESNGLRLTPTCAWMIGSRNHGCMIVFSLSKFLPPPWLSPHHASTLFFGYLYIPDVWKLQPSASNTLHN